MVRITWIWPGQTELQTETLDRDTAADFTEVLNADGIRYEVDDLDFPNVPPAVFA